MSVSPPRDLLLQLSTSSSVAQEWESEMSGKCRMMRENTVLKAKAKKYRAERRVRKHGYSFFSYTHNFSKHWKQFSVEYKNLSHCGSPTRVAF